MPVYDIATDFCICHDSTALVSCADICGDQLIRIWMRAKWVYPSESTEDEKLFVKGDRLRNNRKVGVFMNIDLDGSIFGVLRQPPCWCICSRWRRQILVVFNYEQVRRGRVVCYRWDIDGLVQERRNSIALAMELRLSCTNPSICNTPYQWIDTNG